MLFRAERMRTPFCVDAWAEPNAMPRHYYCGNADLLDTFYQTSASYLHAPYLHVSTAFELKNRYKVVAYYSPSRNSCFA